MATSYFLALVLFQSARQRLEEQYSDANAIGRVCGIVFLIVFALGLIFAVKFVARKLRKGKDNYDDNVGLKL